MDKITAFITRKPGEILVIQHQTSGIQLPAGTVDINETIEEALFREIEEETGIQRAQITSVQKIHECNNELKRNEAVTEYDTPIYSRPTIESFNWVKIRRGITVRVLRRKKNFVQIKYIEWDQFPEKNYISFSITGWTTSSYLTFIKRRHFFLLETKVKELHKERKTDCTMFKPYFIKIFGNVKIINPQDKWMTILKRKYGKAIDKSIIG